MQPQQGTPEALLAAIAQSSNEVTQGWTRLMASAPTSSGVPPWLSELQRSAARRGAMQAAYAERQTQLWSALLAGRHETVAKAEPGDRRFSGKAWRDNPYYDYLKQSYLLPSRYVETLVQHSYFDPLATELPRFASTQSH